MKKRKTWAELEGQEVVSLSEAMGAALEQLYEGMGKGVRDHEARRERLGHFKNSRRAIRRRVGRHDPGYV